jgi:hypothetical protein
MGKEILFTETQKFRQWWLWVILLFVFGIIAFAGLKIISSEELKDKSPLILVGSCLLFILGPIVLIFVNMKLETQVREEGIYVRFYPFHATFRQFKWKNISKSFVRQYDPIGEFGGWGLRIGPAGKAFNVSGDKALHLEFIDNKVLLIGTKKPDELKEALKRIGQLKD